MPNPDPYLRPGLTPAADVELYPSASASAVVSIEAAFAASGALGAAATRVQTVTAAFSGQGELGAAPTARIAANVAFSGAGGLGAPLAARVPLSAAFSGAGGLGAPLAARVPLSAAFSGAGTLEAHATTIRMVRLWLGLPLPEVHQLRVRLEGEGALHAELRVVPMYAARRAMEDELLLVGAL